MSSLHITASQLAYSPSAFRAQAFQLKRTSAPSSTFLRRKFPNVSLKLTSATYRYQQGATVCLFGGKGKPGNENEASPWKSLEKAVGNFKKEQSVEDLLKQQIQKREYYDEGGSGGGKSRGGGGGGGGGSGEPDDEGLSGMWDEFTQVILATLGFVFLYIYIIEGEEITVIVKDVLKFVFKRQKSIRLTRLIDQWKRFFQKMREESEYDDPYWLEREIINTDTWYDSPAKYRLILRALESRSNDDSDEN